MPRDSRDSSATATLCLACSSSLPPRLWKQIQQGVQRNESNSYDGGSLSASGSAEPLLFLTRCCARPICPSCLASNPRLARYDPCLACLGGVGAIHSGKAPGSSVGLGRGPQHVVASNVDGAVRDEDVFVVGDEDEDEDVPEVPCATARPHVRQSASETPKSDVACVESIREPDAKPPDRYYIRPDDTLFGISLRLGVDVSRYR